MNRYKASEAVRKELRDILLWNDTKLGNVPRNYDRIIDEYFEENDFILHGDLRKLSGSNSRNPNKEIIIALLAAIAGSALGIYIATLI